jgi:protein involved in polysaccharide export with SLBB domain
MLLWQQVQKSGVSESDAMKALVKQGMNPADVNSFKKRLIQLQGASKSKFSSESLIKDTASFIRDSSWVIAVPQMVKKSPYYGFEFFSNPNSSFDPNLNVATPKNYILGPGDKLNISVTGLNENSIEEQISREGTLQLPYTTPLSLNGLTIEEATNKIKAKLKVAYPAIATGQTQVSVTLENVRPIHITIIGEVKTPGNYVVSALASFFNVLYQSGGPSDNGSLRKIELIRNNKVIETIDFYHFLQKGILAKNIRLEDQDVIRFPVYDKRVYLAGQVKRPAIYELLDKETLADLISFGGGLGDTAYREMAKVIQVGNQERTIRDIAAVDFGNFIPHNADSVYFEKVLPRFSNRVILIGAVQRPGTYELTNGLTLSKLVKKADGLREDAFLSSGYIKRLQQNGERSLISFDPAKILSGADADIALIKEDSVYLPAKDSIREIPTISAGGSVRNPSLLQFREGMTLENAILMAGGFTLDAATHKVTIYRLEKNKADTLANKLLNVLTIDMDAAGSNGAQTLLEPQDYIFVPRLLNYTSLGSVRLRGQVLYEGDYALEQRDETVQQVIARAGGITPLASMADVQVYRNNLRVGTNLLSGNAQTDEKFLLLPGDSIYIPRKTPFVEIKGAVFNPQIVSFESSNFMSYISDAGGVTDKANLRKAYIQYSNGINKKIRHFLFFRNYPVVKAGSKIIVPEKTDTQRRGLSVVEISALTGTLSALIGLISILKL